MNCTNRLFEWNLDSQLNEKKIISASVGLYFVCKKSAPEKNVSSGRPNEIVLYYDFYKIHLLRTSTRY